MSQANLPDDALPELFDPIAAMAELRRIQALPERTSEEIKQAVTLVRQLRRTNTGPAASKGKKSAKSSPTSGKSLDELLDL